MIWNKKILYALATLSGTIIGVGLFSLPSITLQVGIWVMLAYFLVLGVLVILVHYFFGEVALNTPDYLRLPGFAKIYLGKPGQIIAFISGILGLIGALLACLIVGGEFLTGLLSPIFGGSYVFYVLIYFLIGAILIYGGIKFIGRVEFWGLVLFFVVLIFIFIKGLPVFDIKSLLMIHDSGFKIQNLFLPYGAILFSLWGAALIPEAEEMLKEDKKLLKKIIPISILIPIFVYLFFIFLILGLTGLQTTPSALTGLKNVLGDGIVGLGLFFGVITTFTSFIALGLTLKKIFNYDLKIAHPFSWFIACFIPLILFVLGFQNFIQVISFVGGVMLGVDGILIVLMYHKLKVKKAKIKSLLMIFPLILVFLAGIFYEIFFLIK